MWRRIILGYSALHAQDLTFQCALFFSTIKGTHDQRQPPSHSHRTDSQVLLRRSASPGGSAGATEVTSHSPTNVYAFLASFRIRLELYQCATACCVNAASANALVMDCTPLFGVSGTTIMRAWRIASRV